MDAVHEQERNGLFATLGILTALSIVALLFARGHLLVPAWTLLAIGLPWLAFSIYLRLHRDTAGREGRVVDLWSIPHLVGGVLLGLFDIPLLAITALVVGWELIESVSRVFEHFANRVADVALALCGWLLAQLLFAGSWSLT